MKKTPDDLLQTARGHVAAVHQQYLELFDQRLAEAQDERDQENQRR